MEHTGTLPLDADDTVALIGILAALEALVEGGKLADGEMAALRHSLELGGSVLPGAGEDEIAEALGALNSRLRATIE